MFGDIALAVLSGRPLRSGFILLNTSVVLGYGRKRNQQVVKCKVKKCNVNSSETAALLLRFLLEITEISSGDQIS